MQVDIFQLEDILSHQAEDQTSTTTAPVRNYHDNYNTATSPHISVYNEDDISAYLFNGVSPLSSHHQKTIPNNTAGVDSSTNTQVHYLEAIVGAFDDYYNDAPSVLPAHQQHKDSVAHFSIYAYDSADEDECAISTDDEDEDDFHSPATPLSETGCRHFHTHHISSPPGTDLPPVRPVLSRERDTTAREKPKTMNTAAPKTNGVVPTSTGTTVTGSAKSTGMMIPTEQHVDRIDGPMMSWWPLPVGQIEYEWNDRFYE